MPKDDEEELGMFEIMEEFQRATLAATEILERLGEHTKEIGKRFESSTRDVTQLLERHRQVEHIAGSRMKQDYDAQAKDIANQAADDLDRYAADTAAELQKFKVENRAMFGYLARAVAIQHEFDMPAERLREDRKAVRNLVGVLTASQEHATEFQVSVSGMPALTAKFRKARKRASAMLGELIAELRFSIHEGKSVLEKMPGNDEDAQRNP